jgi:isopenicillin N synthase-like dioxygenase
MADDSANGIPIIDLGALVSAARGTDDWRASAATTGDAIREACFDTGFFYIANHGVGRALFDGAFKANRVFHDRPDGEKLPLKLNAWHRGYQPMASTKMNSSAKFAPAPAPNQLESFIVRDEIAESDPRFKVRPFVGPNQWPDDAGFRSDVDAYYTATRNLGMALVPAFACAVGEAPDYFDPYFEPASTTLRMVHYPPTPERRPDEWFGIYPHTDYGFFTILAQDDVGGLEVQRVDGSWVEAAPVKDAFIMNIGDALMRWTNDAFTSSPHRVLNKSTSQDRYSIAMFFDPNMDTMIHCFDRFVGDLVKHRPIRFEDYYQERMDNNHPDRLPADA